MSEDNIRIIAFQLLECLNSLHQKGIVHNGVMADKMLIDRFEGSHIYFKLSNWAHCLFKSESMGAGYYYAVHNQNEISNYTAPELILKRDFNNKVDVWSATVIIYMCFQ